MPLDIRTSYKEHRDAPRALVQEIDGHRPDLFEVRLQHQRQSHYYDTPLAVGKIDESDATPAVIGREVWRLATEWCKKRGTTKFRCEYRLHDEEKKGVVFETGNPWHCAVDDEGEPTSAVAVDDVNPWSIVKKLAADPHRRYCDLLDRIPKLLDSLAILSEKKGEHDVRIKEIDAEGARDEANAELQMAFMKESMEFLQKFAEPFGVNLADVAEDFLRDRMQGTKTDATGKEQSGGAARSPHEGLLRKWVRLWEAVEADGKKIGEVREHLGDDLWALADAMRNAADDQSFVNQARAFAQRVQAMPDRDVFLMQLAMILGNRHGLELRNILNKATAEEG